jgi:glutamyl-tRNA synthetase
MNAAPSDTAAPVRVRFAPSPTGLLHVGGLRTALYNYLFARRHHGTFILRIEDTDQERFVPGAKEDILAALSWSDLPYDEGPEVGGPYGPYRQSERAQLYRQYAEQLIAAGHAYYAFDTKEELDAMRTRLQQAGKPAPTYNAATRRQMKNALTLPADEVQRRLAAGEDHVVRLKVPRGETVRFEDLIRGWVSFDAAELDDQVLVKSDGLPTYHLANVVDDHLMRVTHVIRGEEWLPSTPKHILLYRFLGWEPPAMAHLPLILSPAGGKLSKRRGDEQGIAVFVKDYQAQGYEPEALVNFLAFLGWNPGTEQEVFSLDELVEAFSLDRVGSAGVQFNLDKLNWYNQQFLRRLTPAALAAKARPALAEAGYAPDDAYLEQVAALMQERLTRAGDLAVDAAYFFEDPAAYDEAGLKKRWKDDSPRLLATYADRLAALDAFDEAQAEATLRVLAEEMEVGAGRIIHPVRLALSGVTFGPSLFEMMAVLGRDTCIRRLRRAVDVLG